MQGIQVGSIKAYQEQKNLPRDSLKQINLLDRRQEEMLADALADRFWQLLDQLVLIQALCLEPQAHISEYLLLQPRRQPISADKARGRLDAIPLHDKQQAYDFLQQS